MKLCLKLLQTLEKVVETVRITVLSIFFIISFNFDGWNVESVQNIFFIKCIFY